MTPREIEAELVSVIRAINANPTSTYATFADFIETDHGYPGIEAAFDSAVEVASRLWGSPAKQAFGGGSIHADFDGVPMEAIPQRTLRYAYWRLSDLHASIAMLSHDADTLRSFVVSTLLPVG